MTTASETLHVSFGTHTFHITHTLSHAAAERSAQLIEQAKQYVVSGKLYVYIGADAGAAALCLAASGCRVIAIAPGAGEADIFREHITRHGYSDACSIYEHVAEFLEKEKHCTDIHTFIADAAYAPLLHEALSGSGATPQAVLLQYDPSAPNPVSWLHDHSYVMCRNDAPKGYSLYAPEAAYHASVRQAVASVLADDLPEDEAVFLDKAKQYYGDDITEKVIVPVLNVRKDRDKYRMNFIGMDAREKRSRARIADLEKQRQSGPVQQQDTTAVTALQKEVSALKDALKKTDTLKNALKEEQDAYKSSIARERDYQRRIDELHAIIAKHADTGITNKINSPATLLQRFSHRRGTASTEKNTTNISPSAFGPSSLKVAAVMDEFTYECYRRECTLEQLLPDNVEKQLEAFCPDMFFIESAWRGKDGAWKQIVSSRKEPILQAIAWCKEHNVPIMFWNKEDPVHFGTFITLAGMVDHVFTTDIDCVPLYKERLGHDNVSPLLFAAQPATHNPIELFSREDAFGFAGSYYLRYPQRQRDFAALVNAAKSFKPVKIYDRNSGNSHPHYQFPDTYKDMLLPALPFADIAKAYKGYRFGMNMNTIKQSQTMFARRAYELLASNTPTISNYSRGVCNVLGDLVLCSDNTAYLSTCLRPLCEDELYYRKFRLAGLRRVMLQHTYRQRLGYIGERLLKKDSQTSDMSVLLLADVANENELDAVLDAFTRQHHEHITLHIVSSIPKQKTVPSGVVFYKNAKDRRKALLKLYTSVSLAGYVHPADYYGEHYVTDMITTLYYSDAEIIGKSAYYTYVNDYLTLVDKDNAYKPSERLSLRRSMVSCRMLSPKSVADILKLGAEGYATRSHMLAIDEFNYCCDAATAPDTEYKIVCSDLPHIHPGIDIETYVDMPKNIPYRHISEVDTSHSIKTITAEDMVDMLKGFMHEHVTVSLQCNTLQITSILEEDAYTYVYFPKIYRHTDLNLVDDSEFFFDVDYDKGQIKSVFIFMDKNRKKISHSMVACHGSSERMAIPHSCVYVKVGMRVQGQGVFRVAKLTLGSTTQIPGALLGNSRHLILAKQYPSYDDIYKYGFLHTRVRAYKKHGLNTDVFRMNTSDKYPFREFEGVGVISGDTELLDHTLSTGRYTHVMAHLIDKKMWDVLVKYLDTVKIIVWAHGAEIQLWQRRTYEFERMNAADITRQKKLSDGRKRFWCQDVFTNMHPNLSMVFVSKYFYEEVAEDFGITVPEKQKHIIANCVDTSLFAYHPKPDSHRFKVLSIRPYASRKYANDLTVQSILLLSKKKEIFERMEFTLYGDGDLYDELTAPLKVFKNVTLHKQFLTHANIAKVHREYGVFLTPTRMDSQGVSRDEAMSSGLVAITTDVTAIPEFIDNSCGRLVPGEDAQAMADAMEELANDAVLFQRLSAAAAKRVRDTLGFEHTIQREIDIIAQKTDTK